MLQRFQRFVLELNDFAVSHINDVMVMPVAVLGGLEAGTTVSEIVALKDLRFFKKTNRPVHGRHADAIIDLDGALMKFLGIRMIIGSREYLGNDAPLASHLKTPILAELFYARREKSFHAPRLGEAGDLVKNCDSRTTLEKCSLSFPSFAEADLFSQITALFGVVRRDHGIICRQSPFLAVFLWGHIYAAAKCRFSIFSFRPSSRHTI